MSDTMFHMAYKGDISGLRRALSAGTDVNKVDSDRGCTRYTGLHGACAGGHGEVLDLLLTHSPDLDKRDYDGLTALHYACAKDHISCVKKLLQAGASVGQRAKRGATPLHTARSGEVVQLLMAHGGDLNVKDDHGQTPLHRACYGNYLSAVQAMLEHQVDIDARDKSRDTPLMLVVRGWPQSGDVLPVVRLLCQHGADLFCEEDGMNVLGLAEGANMTEVLDFLKGM